jgi:hypothetical protein
MVEATFENPYRVTDVLQRRVVKTPLGEQLTSRMHDLGVPNVAPTPDARAVGRGHLS